MRKIEKQEEIEKKSKRNKSIAGLIMVGVMLLSTIGYAFMSSDNNSNAKREYNHIVFRLQNDGLWHFKINNQEFATYSTPEELTNITISDNLNLEDFQDKPLFLYFENDKQAENEILMNLNTYFTRTNPACLKNQENCTWIEQDCSKDNMIIINEANETLIKRDNKCLYIEFKQGEGIQTADAFIFKFLKIT